MSNSRTHHPWGGAVLGAALLPLAGALVGVAAVTVERRGAGERPVLAVVILASAAVAGLAPLRFGLAAALVLAAFEGFMGDFAGDPALYWNEVFVGLLSVRSLFARRPSRWEAAAAAALAALFLLYLSTGTKPIAVFWGAKVLLTSAVAAWALARLPGTGRREWIGAYYGLAAAAAASVVVAGWQRHQGVSGLRALGVPLDGHGPRLNSAGGVRAFAGFTSASPFAYALALALGWWIALVLTRRDRAVGLATAWLPAVAAFGLVWSENRLAPIALLAGLAITGVIEAARDRPRALAAAGVATAAAAAVFLTFGQSKAGFRTDLWSEYVHDFSAAGAGPASAGSAYDHIAAPEWKQPLVFRSGWPHRYEDRGSTYDLTGTRAELDVQVTGERPRPPLVVRAFLSSYGADRTMVARLGSKLVDRKAVRYDRYVPIEIAVPPGAGVARFRISAKPPAQPLSASDSRQVAMIFRDLRIEGLPDPPTPALRVYQRIWLETLNPESHLNGITPGVVDNLYVSWLFQYGVVGGVLAIAWLAALLFPLVRPVEPRSLSLAAGITGGFLAVAALAVNVWEESPVDLVAAAVIGMALGSVVRHKGDRSRRRRTG